MDFAWPSSVDDLRARVRTFLDEAWPERLRLYSFNENIARDLHGAQTVLEEINEPMLRDFWRQIGQADLLRVGVPLERGGLGGGPLERYVVQSEFASVGAPLPLVAMGMVLPTVLEYGTDELMERFFPSIFAGELEFAIGYTEPAAGTDLAALRTSAVRDGDRYVVRGQKLYTSGAHYSEYLWTAVRTDPDAPNHKGISVLIIPMDSPGVTVTPLRTISGTRTNIVFLDDVEVPVNNRVGAEHAGWTLITHALAHERYTALLVSPLIKGYEALTAAMHDDGTSDVEVARLRVRVRVASLLGLRAAWIASTGSPIVAEAAMSKIAVSELRYDMARLAVDLLGNDGLLDETCEGAPAQGQFERMLRHSYITLFAAGANDVQRDLIARRVLAPARSS